MRFFGSIYLFRFQYFIMLALEYAKMSIMNLLYLVSWV